MDAAGRCEELEVIGKKGVTDKLVAARDAIQQALQLGSAAARFDPVLLTSAAKANLSTMESNLDRIIQELRETQ
jgi:hypothetical protein